MQCELIMCLKMGDGNDWNNFKRKWLLFKKGEYSATTRPTNLNVEKQTRAENDISTDRQISLTGQVEAKLVLRKCDFENLCFVDGF